MLGYRPEVGVAGTCFFSSSVRFNRNKPDNKTELHVRTNEGDGSVPRKHRQRQCQDIETGGLAAEVTVAVTVMAVAAVSQSHRLHLPGF